MTRQWPAMSVAIQFSGSTWTDVTSLVLDITASRGRTYELDQSRPGTMHITLDNHSGNFDPSNVSSAYYPNVQLYKPIRVQTTWSSVTTTIWQGYVERWPQSYRSFGNWQMTPLIATDILGLMKQKVFLSSGEEMIQQQAPTYWWPLTSSGPGPNQTLERVNGIRNGTVDTFGGSNAVQFGTNAFNRPPLGLEGAGGATFTPSQPGFSQPTGDLSIIRLLMPTDGNFFPWPSVPWTLSFMVQGTTRPPAGNDSWIIEFTDSGGGNGNGTREYIRFGIGSDGGFRVQISDHNGSTVNTEFSNTQLADGLPHFVSIEFSGTGVNNRFYYTQDALGAGVISSGNSAGWVFNQIVQMNVGGVWAPNQIAQSGYGGVVSELVWFGGQHLVTNGAGGNTPGAGPFLGTGAGTGNLPDVLLNAWENQTSDQRIQALMSLAGFGTKFTSLGTGSAVLQGAVIAGQDAATAILTIGDTEGGVVFVRGDGNLVFSPRSLRYYPTASLTIGDGTVYPVYDLELSYDTQHVVTQAEVDRLNGNVCIASNAAQITAIGLFTQQISSSGENTDNQCFAHAQYIVGRNGAPTTRVQKLVLDLGGTTRFDLLNTLDINTCVQLNHTPLGGAPVSMLLWVESVKYVITPDQFLLEMDATPADARTFLTADTSSRNTIDNTSLILGF